MNSRDEIARAVRPIMDYLRGVSGPDARRAKDALEILERAISYKTETVATLQNRMDHDLSSRGMFDWIWSKEVQTELERLCQEHWWSRRLPKKSERKTG